MRIPAQLLSIALTGAITGWFTLATAQTAPVQTASSSSAKDFQTKEADLALREKLAARIDELTRDEAGKARLVRDAQRRITLCKACHGVDGNAIVENVPSLAGQNPVYLVDQFMRFGDGRRYDYTMSSLATVISDEDKIKLAIYFSEQPMIPAGGGDLSLLPRGEDRYRKLCVDCHGEDGRGAEKGYARLAGQRPEYVVKMLKEFKDSTGRRSNPWMTARAGALSESDMWAVATYLANMK